MGQKDIAEKSLRRTMMSSLTLHGCLDIPEEFKPYVSDYRINLFEIALNLHALGMEECVIAKTVGVAIDVVKQWILETEGQA